jgi:hypothetical protein
VVEVQLSVLFRIEHATCGSNIVILNDSFWCTRLELVAAEEMRLPWLIETSVMVAGVHPL